MKDKKYPEINEWLEEMAEDFVREMVKADFKDLYDIIYKNKYYPSMADVYKEEFLTKTLTKLCDTIENEYQEYPHYDNIIKLFSNYSKSLKND